MALKYIASWVDVGDVVQSLELEVPGYSGDPIDFSDDPIFQAEFNTRWNESPENIKGIGIFNSTATLMAVGDGTLDLQELALSEDRSIIATYKKNGVVNWKGYCIPDSINWQLDGEPYSYSINFTDGLNLLESLPVVVSNIPPPDGAAIRCPLNWFRQILNSSSNLGISLPVEWCMTSLHNSKWLSEDFFAGSVVWGQDERSFMFYNENTLIRRNRSCHYIINNMLKSAYARLFQKNGVWHIERIPDVYTGEYTKYRVPASLSGTPEVTSIDVDENKTLGEGGWPTQNAPTVTVKKGLRSVVAKYEHNQSENVWPNGDMTVESLGSVVYWDIDPQPTSSFIIRQDSITQRGQNSIRISNTPTVPTGQYAGLTVKDQGKITIPIDMNVLYGRFKWGFTFMPEFWLTDSETGFIKWDDSPMKAKVALKMPASEGGTKDLVLNEFGFWSADPEVGGRLNLFYYDTNVTGSTFQFTMRINGVPVAGDSIKYDVWEDEFKYFANNDNQGDILKFLTDFKNDILTRGTFTWSISSFIDGIHFNAYQLIINGNTSDAVGLPIVYLTDSTTPDGTIRFKVDQMMIGDIAKISFQSKTLNDGWILFPDPGDLNGILDPGVAELSITLMAGNNQVIRYEDVYVTLDDNYDVYEATITASKNTATGEISTEISSQFTGLIPSNYQSSFTLSNEQFKYTNGHGNWSLTRVLAESILRFNSKSSILVQDLEFYCEDGDFSFGQIYEIPSFEGKKFLTLAAEYNNQTRVATVTACEISEDSDSSISTIHYGNNEYANSN